MSNIGKGSISQAEIDARLNEFETRLEGLKHAYDRYFNGIDRRPPDQLRKDVVRALHTLEHKTYIRNTAQKFRLQSLVQRFQSYKQYWDRIIRQIEEGTFARDRFKAARNIARKERAEATDQQGPLELDLDFDAIDDLDVFAQNVAAELERAPQPAPSPELPPRHVAPQPTPQAIPQPTASQAGSGEDLRARKIMELQAKLGLAQTGSVAAQHTPAPQPAPTFSQPAPTDSQTGEEERRSKLAAMRRRLEQRQGTLTPGAEQLRQQNELRGADQDTARQMAADRERMARLQQQQQHAAQARQQASSSDDSVQQVYRNLIEAKRRCNESTDNLSYESVARSMAQQRERLRQTHNANDVDFKVVIKDGRAFLKPEPK